MPKTYFKIYPDRQLVSIHWAGIPSVEEWYKMIELVLGHPDYRRGMSLITYRAGSHSAITPTYVRGVLQALELRSQWMNPMNIAMVAPAAATFGMKRMAETLAESTTLCVKAFKRTRDALQWLEAPRPHVNGGFHASRQLAVAVMTDIKAREIATALRLARFRGEMTDDVFAQLVKEVVRVLYPVLRDVPVRNVFGNFPPPKLAAAI